MLLLDRIEQSVELNEELQYYNTKDKDYTLTIVGEKDAILKTNPGRTLNDGGMNLGASPMEAEKINKMIVERLGLKVIGNKTIEYCLDIETDFKLVDNKHILKSFLKALAIHKYRSGKIDFVIQEDKWLDKSSLKGLKGYKTSRAMKIYSKLEEQGIGEVEGDLVRIELILGARALEKNKVKNISDVSKAVEEMKEFLISMRSTIKRANRYSKNTVYIIEKALEKLNEK
ncbi:MAG: hypothetical protein ACRC6A_11500 [Fusobacteriaceae bacterium]